ncbi:phenol hydroxylase [Lineolata rhizophorae]|uniref:Phenol hydroxylase n=1 Tax=Lineolata rhizophorae TaxID=578093 RepID=A0A6A6NTE9_9PEZI|nr:phenol hydroxylase [Lineolata rhizophorae]
MPGAAVPESECDVLIVGAGPAGLMLTAWMARLGVKARTVDKRGTKVFAGQADGLQCRSLEIFDSFGFADRNPGPDGAIRRSDSIPDTLVGVSRFQEVVLHQGRIERFFLDHISKHSSLRIERGVLPEALAIDEGSVDDPLAHPITVTLRHLTEEEATPHQAAGAASGSKNANGEQPSDGLFRSNLAEDDTDELIRKSSGREGSTEVVRCKYMVGCDGAHSWTRRQLGFEMQGEATDFIWGVLDIIPLTDFPDIRCRCAIHSADSGSVMVIPRENKLVRLYIQLKEIVPDASGRADRSKITPETILKAAQKTLSPYKLDYEYCDWWTAYQIGQRVGTNFDAHQRVFLAGDAVHTHSPKAGQGMNVSMQDAYNLGWKVGLAALNRIPRAALKTYQSERRRVAQDLIAFDHKFSRLFSGRPAKDVMDEAGVSMAEFKDVFVTGSLFATGLSVDYGASLLVAKEGSPEEQGDGTSLDATAAGAAPEGPPLVGKQHLATNVKMGMRFPSYQVVCHADARPWPFQHFMRSDGRFRLVIFAGDVSLAGQKARLDGLCKALAEPGSFLRRLTPGDAGIDAVVEVLALHSAPRRALEWLADFPEVLHPWRPRSGWEYDRIFVDAESYHEGHGRAYEGYGVDKERGCVVVLRPDQYVAYVGELEDVADLERYFGAVLLEPEVWAGRGKVA